MTEEVIHRDNDPRKRIDDYAFWCVVMTKKLEKLSADPTHPNRDFCIELLRKRINKRLAKIALWNDVQAMLCMRGNWHLEYRFKIPPIEYVCLKMESPAWFEVFNEDQYKLYSLSRFGKPVKSPESIEIKKQAKELIERAQRVAEALK